MNDKTMQWTLKNSLQALALIFLLPVLLTGCGGGGDGGGASTYTVGGTVSGMSGTGLVLNNNGGDALTITGNGSFSFGTSLNDGTAYSVTIATQASGQTCRVSNGTGTVSGANVTNIAVSCGIDPTGYYTGSVTTASGTLSDAQFLVNGTRMMIVSDANVVVYDGQLNITGSDFTSTMTIYKNGIKEAATTEVSGSFVHESQIVSSTILTGSGYGSGTMAATYDATYNARPATKTILAVTEWAAGLNEDLSDFNFRIDANGNLSHFSNATGNNFNDCQFYGTILPVGTTHLYEVSITASACLDTNVNGSFTGLAVTKDNGGTDNRLVFTVTDGEYATGDDYVIQ